DRDTDRTTSSLWRRTTTADGPAERLGAGDDGEPRFSPDGRRLAFLRRAETTELWVVPADGGAERRLTDTTAFPLGVSAPYWSPDARRIAFVAPVRVHRDPAAPLVTDRLDYKADGAGYL